MNIKAITIFPLLIVTLLVGCTSTLPQDQGGTGSLAELQALTPGASVTSTSSTNSIRLMALQEGGLSIGAQSGLAWRAKQIDALLEQQQASLSQVYNLSALLLPHNVLPPVLEEGRQSLNLADNSTIRLADMTYQIVSQARFVTTSPHWREYLWMNYPRPDRPDSSLLPQNKLEQAIWRKSVKEGWQHGIVQADAIYTENLARIARDFKGMILYRKLLAQNMVSAPFVAKANLGVTGGGSNMRINDQILRITALPTLQVNSRHWKPQLSQ